MRNPRLSGPERERVAAGLKAKYEKGGTSIRALAAESGRSYGAVYSLLTEAGALSPVRVLKRGSSERERVAAQLKAKYDMGASTRALAAEIGRSEKNVRDLLIDAGTTFRPRGVPPGRNAEDQIENPGREKVPLSRSST